VPVYEYGCKKCKREFEYQQRMDDPPKKKCEACGGALERLISRTSFQLKGSGWYKDLYSSSKPDAGSAGEAAGESAKDVGGTGAKDAATPAATEAKPSEKASDKAADKKKVKKPAKASSKGR
jgi:putative FmdB family regulatory protein